MEQEIEKFDPSKLMDGVKDRIKATFVSLIPDDAWKSMVEKEIYVFTTGKITISRDTDFSRTDENGNHPIITKEIRTPYSQKPLKDSWNHETGEDDISPLQKMIREELRKKFCENLKEWLDSDDYKSTFTHYGAPQISKAVEDILTKNADTIFYYFMANMMQQAFVAMRANINHSIQTGNFNPY